MVNFEPGQPFSVFLAYEDSPQGPDTHLCRQSAW